MAFLNVELYGSDLHGEVKDSIKQYFDNQIIASRVLIDTASNNNAGVSLLNEIKSQGLINDFEYNSLKTLIYHSYEAKAGQLAISDLETNVQNIKNAWLDADPEREMVFLASVVYVSEYSIDWWQDNPTQGDTTYSTELAPWAAADIAGGIIGAGHQVIVSGEVSWNTGKAAVLGAAATSAGATLRLAKWIGGLF